MSWEDEGEVSFAKSTFIVGLLLLAIWISSPKAKAHVEKLNDEPFFGVVSSERLYINIPSYCTNKWGDPVGNQKYLDCTAGQYNAFSEVNNHLAKAAQLATESPVPLTTMTGWFHEQFHHCIEISDFNGLSYTINWVTFSKCIDATIRSGFIFIHNQTTGQSIYKEVRF